ncbi:MAG: hypothetical protein U1E83_06355 [Methylotetracoccus sp.]
MKWLTVLLTAISTAGCGMLGVARQVVIDPGKVDDYQSPAWIINSPPAGAPIEPAGD